MNAGDMDRAFSLQLRANNIYAALDAREVGGLIPGIKYIMREYYGVDAGYLSPLSPNRELTDTGARERLMKIFRDNIFA